MDKKNNVLFTAINQLIEDDVIRYELITYWQIGKRINEYFTDNNLIVSKNESLLELSKQLIERYGSICELNNIYRMMQLATDFPDEAAAEKILSQLTWPHILLLLPLTLPLQRDYYLEKCLTEKWTVNILEDKIKSMLYELELLELYNEGINVPAYNPSLPSKEMLENKLYR